VQGICTYIQSCNDDIYCLGVLVQLPLPAYLLEHTHTIVDSIVRYKDVDGLGADFLGKSYNTGRDVVSATPSAVLGMCDWYGIDLEGKRVVIVGQSHLIGKPLAVQCINR
jgi:methylenetetrahydrofolate dehydrogenase (NADP+) / methenyltetrahydrofolate cyclohydrolase